MADSQFSLPQEAAHDLLLTRVLGDTKGKTVQTTKDFKSFRHQIAEDIFQFSNRTAERPGGNAGFGACCSWSWASLRPRGARGARDRTRPEPDTVPVRRVRPKVVASTRECAGGEREASGATFAARACGSG